MLPRFSQLLVALALLASPVAFAKPPSPDADNGGLTLPPGFRAFVVADDLGSLRQMAIAPNGDIYLKTLRGGIIGLRDADGDGRAETKVAFGSGGGTGIALRGDWLYHSTNDAVFRYRLTPGQLAPGGEHERIVRNLPSERSHAAKTIAFDGEGRLLVEVGTPTNALGNPDRAPGAKGLDYTGHLEKYGGFWRFDPDRPDQTQAEGTRFSTGHRHILTIAWNDVAGDFFTVMQGRDQLDVVAPQLYTSADNAELPGEEFHVLRKNSDLGWPSTYWDPQQKKRVFAPEYGGDRKKTPPPGRFQDPIFSFPAHWSPMQMAFYRGTQFPEKYRGGAFIAFHGSWNRAPLPQKGYQVAFVPFDPAGSPLGTWETFADNFAGTTVIASPRDARFRPNGLAVGPDGSLYVADSLKGRVWRIIYTGESASAKAN